MIFPRPPKTIGRALAPKAKTDGFTLIEMVVSLAVISVLLVGMSSAIVLASKALPHTTNPAGATVDASRALHQLRDDLSAATELFECTATSVTLNLPDRDGDGRAEVVTYAWSGVAGDPLTRVINGNTATNVIDEVEQFSLGYAAEEYDVVFPGADIQSSEILLSSFEQGEANEVKDDKLDGDELFANQITPTLPAEAEQYTVTRVLVYADDSGGADGVFEFQIRPMESDGPAATVTDRVEIQESDLVGDWSWIEARFDSARPFAADEDFAVVLENISDSTAGEFEYDNLASINPMFYGDNVGGSEDWNQSNNDHLFHFAYGTYTQQLDDWTFTVSRIRAVEIELVHQLAENITHHMLVPLINAPESADPLWIADFNADPTTLDLDNDGTSDWSDGNTGIAATVADGKWEAVDGLTTMSAEQDLDAPFVVQVSGQDTIDNGDNGRIRVRFDRDSTMQASVKIQIDRIAQGQETTIFGYETEDDKVTWVTTTEPAGENVLVTLHFDPANDTVGVNINGQTVGSYQYERFNSTEGDNLTTYVDGDTSGFFLEHLRLSVGGTATITPGAY